MSGFAEWIEGQARGGRDFHHYLHHRLRQPPAVIEGADGHLTVSPDLLGEAVVLVDVLRRLLRRSSETGGAAAVPPTPTGSPSGWSLVEHCAAVALALEGRPPRGRFGRSPSEPGDADVAGRINKGVTGRPAPRGRRAREEMGWHKALAAQWFSGALDEGCDLCEVSSTTGAWLVSGVEGTWR
jgi:hypothetical protein